jgi:hypothetical protein
VLVLAGAHFDLTFGLSSPLLRARSLSSVGNTVRKQQLLIDVFCPLLSLDDQLFSFFRLPSLAMLLGASTTDSDDVAAVTTSPASCPTTMAYGSSSWFSNQLYEQSATGVDRTGHIDMCLRVRVCEIPSTTCRCWERLLRSPPVGGNAYP